jgi:hypothetical protein
MKITENSFHFCREQLSSPEDENEKAEINSTTSSMHQFANSILPNHRSSWSTIHRTQSLLAKVQCAGKRQPTFYSPPALLKPITFEMVDDLMDSNSSEFKQMDQQYPSLYQIKKLSLKRRHKMKKRSVSTINIGDLIVGK